MLRKEGRSASAGGCSDVRSTASRRNSRGADAKSSMGSRVSRTNAVPVMTGSNDVRCVAARYDMVLSNDCRRGMSIYAGGKHGVVSVRSALSAASSVEQIATGRSTSRSRLSSETASSENTQRKHGALVTCMVVVAGDMETHLWCGLSDGSIQVYRAASSGPTALSQPPSPRSLLSGTATQVHVQSATPKCLLFEARHHNGPVNCIASAEFAVFTGGADWKINRWSVEAPFGVLGCVGSHSLAVRCLHVTGRALASGGDDGKIKLWPFTNVDKPAALEGHTAAVLTCTVHRGTLWSGGEDATIRLWAIEGDRRCLMVITTHRTPVVALHPTDALMMSFDKGGNALVWDLNKPPPDIEALHCYQCIGGVQPPMTTSSSSRRDPASGANSRSTSEASAFVPSVGRFSSASEKSAAAAAAVKAGAGQIAPPVAIHDVKLVANVHGYVAWVFTGDGAKLSFLPLRSIEEELEVKYGEHLDDVDDAGSGFASSRAAVDDLQRQLSDAQQREERLQSTFEEAQEEFAEFSDILAEDLAEMLSETLELFTTAQARAGALFGASVSAVQNQTLKAANNMNKKTHDLEAQIDELNTKLADRARQLAQANAKASTLVAAKQEEITKVTIDLQRAVNETKQIQFELKSLRDNNATLETVIKRHEAKLDKAARADVEAIQLRSELKMTKEALEKMQLEAGRQAESAALQRAKVMGDDATRSKLLEDLEAKLTAAMTGESAAQSESRKLASELRALQCQLEDVEGELRLLRNRNGNVAQVSEELADNLRKRLKEAQEENDALRAQLTSRPRDAADGPSSTPSTDSALPEMQAELERRASRIAELEAKVGSQQQRVDEMQAAVQALQATLVNKASRTPAAPDNTDGEKEALRGTIAELENVVGERDRTIAALQEELESLRSEKTAPTDVTALAAEIQKPPEEVSSRRALQFSDSPPKQTTQATAQSPPRNPAMSPLERLQFDMDAVDLPAVTARHPPSDFVTSPAAGGNNFARVIDGTPAPGRQTSFLAARSVIGSHGLMALRDAERILGSHRISLSGPAHSLALTASLEQRTTSRSDRRRDASPQIMRVVEETAFAGSDDDEPVDEDYDPELSRLLRIIDRTQSRLQKLERELPNAKSDSQKEAMLREIAVLHSTLTTESFDGVATNAMADRGNTTSVLNAARLRLAAAERIRTIREMPVTGGGSPTRAAGRWSTIAGAGL